MIKVHKAWDAMFNKPTLVLEYEGHRYGNYFKIQGTDGKLYEISKCTARGLMVEFIEKTSA